MTKKSITEIRAEHSRRGTEILNGYRDGLDALRRKREPEGVEYMAGLDGGQKMEVLGRQKKEAANEAYRRAREEYVAEVDRYHGEIKARRPELERSLFTVEGPEGAAMLSRMALASEADLGALLDVASRARNRELAKAVFVAAEGRNLGELVARYFDEFDAEARDLYAELREVPPQDILDRQLSSVDRIVEAPNLDQLVYTATGTT